MGADSSAFDAKGYYEQLITTASLPALLKRENDLLAGLQPLHSHLEGGADGVFALCTEIRQLDSERQSLVYNHHHELIAASDTIAAVRCHSPSFKNVNLDILVALLDEDTRGGLGC